LNRPEALLASLRIRKIEFEHVIGMRACSMYEDNP
jgi:hypothetical protein